jgi:prepilin-type N-terminal cleavage/methylation domain-containing protein
MSALMRRKARDGFTLVELLVVLAVVGILLGLMLPAIQASREAARKAECQHHLRQLATAMQTHHSAYGRFPTGGWGFVWVGDPDRGTDRRQPGGWAYNILPYLEQGQLRDVGKGESTTVKERRAGTPAKHPLKVFNCPSRRSSR